MTFRTGAYPQVIAHRGGSLLRPENTLVAFTHAYALGVRTIETDLHLTRDGELVCHHDYTVDRTTDGRGPLRAHTLAELAALDAGHAFTTDGTTYPYRGRDVRVPTLAAALESCPDASFVLELKPEGAGMAEAVFRFLERHEARDRVCVASFHEPTIAAFRARARGAIRTSAGQSRLAAFWARAKLPGTPAPLPFQMMQVPPRHRGLEVVTAGFVRAAHAVSAEVHAWTIDEPDEMRRLLDLGVDAIITDAPDRAIDVVRARGGR